MIYYLSKKKKLRKMGLEEQDDRRDLLANITITLTHTDTNTNTDTLITATAVAASSAALVSASLGSL